MRIFKTPPVQDDTELQSYRELVQAQREEILTLRAEIETLQAAAGFSAYSPFWIYPYAPRNPWLSP
jgi:hypothetical protein